MGGGGDVDVWLSWEVQAFPGGKGRGRLGKGPVGGGGDVYGWLAWESPDLSRTANF